MDNKFQINLESLIDLSGRLNETNDEMFILNSALLSLMGKLRTLRGTAYVPDIKRKQYIPLIIKGKQSNSPLSYFEFDDILTISHNTENELILYELGYKYAIPVIYQNKILSMICLGERITNDNLDKYEIQYSGIVASITANALQNANNHNSLIKSKNSIEKRNQMLTTLFEMSRDFSNFLSKNEILKILSYRLMGQLMVTRFAVIIISSNAEYDVIINRFEKTIPDEVIQSIISLDSTGTINDLVVTAEHRDILEETGAKIISPMIVQGNIKGILVVGKKLNSEEFSEENIKFIEALGNISISALENERLFLEELEKERLESEVQLALEIQTNLLPKDLPDCQEFEFSGISLPSRSVGGDYYDFIKLDENRILTAIADVSGKGMPAALLMANVQAALRTLAPLDLPLKELILRINNVVYHNTTPDKFVTFFCGILDCREKTFKYINAGHNPPLLFKNNGSIIPLSEGGMILGITDQEMQYSDDGIKFEKDDFILFYTDGVTEAMDINHKEFSEDKLISIIKDFKSENLKNCDDNSCFIKDILYEILTSVQKHSEGVHQSDDITLSAIRCFA